MEDIKNKIPFDFFQKNHLLPIDSEKIGICEKTTEEALEDLRLLLGKNLKPVMMAVEEIQEGLKTMLIEEIGRKKEDVQIIIEDDETQNLMGQTKDAPVIRLVNSLFLKAVDLHVSDIHVEPYEDEAKIRFRIDGILHEMLTLPRVQLLSIVSRIKVMSKLNLAERRLPQDGRMRVTAHNTIVDVRVSTLPTLFGERVVLRLLDSAAGLLTLKELGLEKELREEIKKLISNPYGFILVTGPTGSGKSTTLYAILHEIMSPFKNVITIEDPVEYQIKGIGQIQVNPKINLTFASGLRSIVRQDPDIIMVGEIRDPETADIAVHAALTGHLVLSTLHTNDAPTAISRLVDMNIEPFLISSSLKGVAAQRLVRRLCSKCREPYVPSVDTFARLGLRASDFQKNTFYGARGCPECLNSGFKGRIGIFELMIINEEMQRLINHTSDASAIRALAKDCGMIPLGIDGVKKILAGLTTVEEVLSATMT